MIIVEHIQEGSFVAYWSIKDAIPNETAAYAANYFLGEEKPHYPMPATLSNADTATSYNDGFLLELLVTRIEHEL